MLWRIWLVVPFLAAGLCHADEGRAISLIRQAGVPGSIRCLAYSLDGKLLYAGTQRHDWLVGDERDYWRGRVFALRVNDLSIESKHDADQWVNSLAISPDGRLLAAALGRYLGGERANRGFEKVPGEIEVLEPTELRPIRRLEHSLGAFDVVFSPSGKHLAAATRSDDDKGAVIVWETAGWSKKYELPLRNAACGIVFAGDSMLYVASRDYRNGLDDRGVYRINVEEAKTEHILSIGRWSAVEMSPSDERLILVGARVNVYSLQRREYVARLSYPTNLYQATDFQVDRNLLYAAGNDGHFTRQQQGLVAILNLDGELWAQYSHPSVRFQAIVHCPTNADRFAAGGASAKSAPNLFVYDVRPAKSSD